MVLFFINKIGVEVLLEAPDTAKFGGKITGAEPFETVVTPVTPSDALQTPDHEAIGVTFDVMEDEPSVREYGN